MYDPPPDTTTQKLLPITSHSLETYKLWYGYKNNLPKDIRYTLGEKIDSTFISILECLFIAGYQNKTEKLPTLILATKKTDLLKFFVRVIWELRVLDDKKYIIISENLEDLGRMIGGWRKGLENKVEQKPREANNPTGNIYKLRRENLIASVPLVVVALPRVDVPLTVVGVPVHVHDTGALSYSKSSLPMSIENSPDCILFET